MTLAMAWVRSLPGQCEELIFATDSRLTGGKTVDCCPKILIPARSDCAICFAGDTDYAYPLMLQMSYAMQHHEPCRTRAMDIRDLRGHLIKIVTHYISSVVDNRLGTPDISLIFGGYSWTQKEFNIYRIYFNKNENRVVYESAKNPHGLGKVIYAGDWANQARTRVFNLLRERDKISGPPGIDAHRFDFEPFEVLRDCLREAQNNDSIGGAPQIVKVYQHLNCRATGVYWPDVESQQVNLLGRPLFDYENIDAWILDPDRLYTSRLVRPITTEEVGRTEPE